MRNGYTYIIQLALSLKGVADMILYKIFTLLFLYMCDKMKIRIKKIFNSKKFIVIFIYFKTHLTIYY